MTWSDIANPKFFNVLFGAFTPSRPASSFEARRRGLLEALEAGEVSDFEDTRPCRWLLTEPPALDAQDASEHAETLR